MSTFYDFRYDASAEKAAPSELKKLQEKILMEHLKFCKANSPYYREKLAEIRLDGDSFPLERLHELPFSDRDTIAAQGTGMLAVPEKDIADIVFSSGTTGRPIPIYYSANDMRRLAFNEEKAFRNCGMTDTDRVLLTCTIDRCFIAGEAYYMGVRAIGAAAIRNGLNTLESHASVIQTLAPTMIVGVPSFLKRLGQYLKAENIPASSVRGLVCIGEPLRERDLSLNSLGLALKKIWNAEVYSTYASSEIATSFCDCTKACGGHMPPDLAILEIVDDDGNVLGPGETGEVTVTPMRVTGMPLIRFKTGDISFYTDEPCACGRRSPRLGPVIGRRRQMMKINGTTVFPSVISTALDELEEISGHYIVAYEKKDQGFYRAEVHVTLNGCGHDVEKISRKLHAATRVNIPVKVVDPESLNARVFGGKSRKPVRFFAVNEDTSGSKD